MSLEDPSDPSADVEPLPLLPPRPRAFPSSAATASDSDPSTDHSLASPSVESAIPMSSSSDGVTVAPRLAVPRRQFSGANASSAPSAAPAQPTFSSAAPSIVRRTSTSSTTSVSSSSSGGLFRRESTRDTLKRRDARPISVVVGGPMSASPQSPAAADPGGPRKIPQPAMPDDPRYRIAYELLQTEATFVSALDTVIAVFLAPLRQSGDILTEKEINAIFGNVEMLRDFNASFLTALQEQLATWDSPNPNDQVIGGLFLEYCPRFPALYQPYCNNFNNALAELVKLEKKKKEFKDFLDVRSGK